MIATDDPLQDRPRAGVQDRTDERLAGAVRVMACEAAPLEAADPGRGCDPQARARSAAPFRLGGGAASR